MEKMHSKKIFLCVGLSAFSPVEKMSLRCSAETEQLPLAAIE